MPARLSSLVCAVALLLGAGCNSVVCVSGSLNPAIVSISPGTALTGGSMFVLVIIGRDFTPDSVVEFNGSTRPTVFMSNGELRATIFAADLAKTGTAVVTVSGATACGRRVSNAVNFTIVL